MAERRKISDAQILRLIQEFPGITKRELAAILEVSRQAMIYRLRRMEARGKITHRVEDRSHRYWAFKPRK